MYQQNSTGSGIWLHRVKDVTVTGGQIEKSSWSSNAYASGNLNIGKAENVTIDGLDITAHRSGTVVGLKPCPILRMWMRSGTTSSQKLHH